MDAFLAHQRLIAAHTRIAQPTATMCHRRVSPRPMVMCAYHLAGDPGAPVGFLYGTHIDSPNVIVIGEPRNRDLRFRGLERLAQALNAYFDDFRTCSPVLDRYGQPKLRSDGMERSVADDAPQLVVPNSGTADWLALLARSTVWLRTEGEFAVDPVLPRFGAHLTHLAGRRALPGSADIIAATELLDLHWTTGQTDFEDANLATLLSWIDPTWISPAWFPSWTSPFSGVEAAKMAETLPSAGPVPDPIWDMQTLEPAVAAFNAARSEGRSTGRELADLEAVLVDALTPAWTASWRALCAVGGMTEAASVQRRWETDRWAWTSHLNRSDAGRAFFRRQRTAVQSARLLDATENAAAEVQAAMALDDPLVMARYVAAGEAIEGTVVDRDDAHFELGPSGKRQVERPIIKLAADDAVLQPVGTRVVWVPDLRVRGEIHRLPITDDGAVEIKITNGMRTGAMPGRGDRGCFTTIAPPTRYPHTVPDTVPWTHALPVPQISDGDIA
jgi:hypothetical protein